MSIDFGLFGEADEKNSVQVKKHLTKAFCCGRLVAQSRELRSTPVREKRDFKGFIQEKCAVFKRKAAVWFVAWTMFDAIFLCLTEVLEN